MGLLVIPFSQKAPAESCHEQLGRQQPSITHLCAAGPHPSTTHHLHASCPTQLIQRRHATTPHSHAFSSTHGSRWGPLLVTDAELRAVCRLYQRLSPTPHETNPHPTRLFTAHGA